MKTLLPARHGWTLAGFAGLLTIVLAFPLAFAGNGGDDGMVGGLPLRGGGPSVPGTEPGPALFFVGSDHAIAGSITHVFHHGDVHLAGLGDDTLLAVQADTHVVLDVARLAWTGVQTFVWLPDDQVQLILPSQLSGPSPVTLVGGRLDVDVPRALYVMNRQGFASLEFLVSGPSGVQRLVLSQDATAPRAMHVVLDQL